MPSDTAFQRWFYISRFWSGKIIYIGIKHWCISLDFRVNWIRDLIESK